MRNCRRETTCLGARGVESCPESAYSHSGGPLPGRAPDSAAAGLSFLAGEMEVNDQLPSSVCSLPLNPGLHHPPTYLSPKSESSSLPSQLQNSCTFCIPFFDIVSSQCFKWHTIKEKNSKKFPVNKLNAVQSCFPFWGQGWIEETDTTHWFNIQFLSLRFKMFWESNT